MIKIDQMKMKIGFSEQDLIVQCAKNLKIEAKHVKSVKILKKSVDARHKPNVAFVLSVGVELDENLEEKFDHFKYVEPNLNLEFSKKTCKHRPVVVGFGPSGMFAALCLARMGLKPIVLEQGKCTDEREKDVQNFWQNGILNEHSNVQFGEGGAGTFSDGKLNTNANNLICKKVLFELFKFGAPKEILFESKPHIGSDKLKQVVVNLRKEIVCLGGEVVFDTKFCKFDAPNGVLKSVVAQNVETKDEFEIETNHLVLCLGHSARDTIKMLFDSGIKMCQKPFAMGVRIEQLQKDVNEMQYGKNHNPLLPPADYKFAVHLPNGRSVFTFCMCPGGQVVASSSANGEVVTNGMSNFDRSGNHANSALLVNVLPQDYQSSHPLAGLSFQAKYERLAFELGGKNFCAPAESVASFLGKKQTKTIECSYRPNIKLTQISKCLPAFVSQSLKMGIALLNKKAKGFAKDENLLVAIESRSSSPVTILRDEGFETNIKGIYPVGEGAGYAGGIVTSAQDGIKAAQIIFDKL